MSGHICCLAVFPLDDRQIEVAGDKIVVPPRQFGWLLQYRVRLPLDQILQTQLLQLAQKCIGAQRTRILCLCPAHGGHSLQSMASLDKHPTGSDHSYGDSHGSEADYQSKRK